MSLSKVCSAAALALPLLVTHAFANGDRSTLDSLISHHARLNGVPETLVHRVVMRESRYNPRAVSKGNFGLMQIRHATARGMGYTGSAGGLLDANTNLTYAVKYLAGALQVADGNHDQAVRYYASGYYYAAKRKGLVATASYKSRKAKARYAKARGTDAGAIRQASN